MTIFDSKSAFSSHWTALESCGRVSASRAFLSRMATVEYLGVAPLVGEIPRVDQDIALGQLDSSVVGVADAHDAGSPRGAGRWRS